MSLLTSASIDLVLHCDLRGRVVGLEGSQQELLDALQEGATLARLMPDTRLSTALDLVLALRLEEAFFGRSLEVAVGAAGSRKIERYLVAGVLCAQSSLLVVDRSRKRLALFCRSLSFAAEDDPVAARSAQRLRSLVARQGGFGAEIKGSLRLIRRLSHRLVQRGLEAPDHAAAEAIQRASRQLLEHLDEEAG